MTWLARLASYMAVASALLLLMSFPTPAQATSISWPGQSGNPVGYAAIGPLGTSACPSVTSGTAGNPTFITNCKFSSCPTISASYIVFMSVDWNCGTGGLAIGGTNITFYGNRIQSNQVGNYNTKTTGSNIYFMYTSFVPLASFYTAPPGMAWPAAAAGQNTLSCNSDTLCVNGNDGFETSVQVFSGGPVWMDHIDTWGMGGGPTYVTATTAQMTLTESWIHDNADPSPQGYHSDGIACYVNGNGAPDNLLFEGNTVASIGNTNGLACQAASAGYSNLQINENYFSGYGYNIAFCAPSSILCTNSTFVGNTHGTDVMDYFGPVYGSTIPTSTFWGCNKNVVTAGTSWTNQNGWKPSASDNGKFLLPNGAAPNLSSTDYNGNTVCGQTNPAALDFKTQTKSTTSSGQTVTFTNTGSSSLSVGTISLATGSDFAISSNTCGASLAANASCNITVTFTPATLGPQTDTLNITNGMASPANVMPVPLIGLGVGGSVSAPPQVLGFGAQVR